MRRQAIEHHLHVIEVGKARRLEGDHGVARRRLELSRTDVAARQLRSRARVPAGSVCRAADDWRLFTEHKPYEPAFYATVVQDWGSSLLLAQSLGERAQCLVDLGHHLPNTNIELIVARLLGVGKLGGFHFNDSKYGDDDLTAGSIKPYVLFLIFHELVLAERERLPGFDPAYMIDQSHNLKDPIEVAAADGRSAPAGVREGVPRRSRRARRASGVGRRDHGGAHAQARVRDRRAAARGGGASPARRRAGSGARVPRVGLSGAEDGRASAGAAGGAPTHL